MEKKITMEEIAEATNSYNSVIDTVEDVLYSIEYDALADMRRKILASIETLDKLKMKIGGFDKWNICKDDAIASLKNTLFHLDNVLDMPYDIESSMDGARYSVEDVVEMYKDINYTVED